MSTDFWAQLEATPNWKMRWYAFRRGVRRIAGVHHDVHRAWQRVHRGWDYRSVWSLDAHLAKVLGEQLVYMADIAHGWPSYTYETFDDWVAALRANGETLLRYYRESEELLPTDASIGAAREAIHWVADNFTALWD